MTTWYTADPHFGHARIIGYTDRPFADVAQMDAFLVDSWNAHVRPQDTVWVLGDVALGNLDESLLAIGQLAGTKIMVPGNHDRCWQGQRKGALEARARYLDAGFDDVVDAPDAITVAGRRTLLSHFPYRGDSRDVERHQQHRPADRGEWLVHGHVHQVWRQRHRMVNVGVDAWGGRPVAAAELDELVAAGPRDLAPLPWPTVAGASA